ncbi:MAG: hypothetical protein LBE74_05600 [Treponema sp.]|jgi:hypothetical protein|nr:hypothetical protein [Treponema sp.]
MNPICDHSIFYRLKRDDLSVHDIEDVPCMTYALGRRESIDKPIMAIDANNRAGFRKRLGGTRTAIGEVMYENR